jgi:hypothetical protein
MARPDLITEEVERKWPGLSDDSKIHIAAEGAKEVAKKPQEYWLTRCAEGALLYYTPIDMTRYTNHVYIYRL